MAREGKALDTRWRRHNDWRKSCFKLRTNEADKVHCGKKHFEALGVPVAVAVTADEV